MFKIVIELPRHLKLHPDPCEEAKFYAEKFKEATTEETKDDIFESLLANGATWDVVTRSCIYYPTFEKEVGYEFPECYR